MFSLIISIISIALVVALVAATMYYGGDTLNQGRTEADAATVVSAAQQIGGAIQMHVALRGAEPATLQELVDNGFLTSVPSALGNAFSADFPTNTLSVVVASAETCTVLNENDDSDPDTTEVYGCVTAGTPAVSTFTYNF